MSTQPGGVPPNIASTPVHGLPHPGLRLRRRARYTTDGLPTASTPAMSHPPPGSAIYKALPDTGTQAAWRPYQTRQLTGVAHRHVGRAHLQAPADPFPPYCHADRPQGKRETSEPRHGKQKASAFPPCWAGQRHGRIMRTPTLPLFPGQDIPVNRRRLPPSPLPITRSFPRQRLRSRVGSQHRVRGYHLAPLKSGARQLPFRSGTPAVARMPSKLWHQ